MQLEITMEFRHGLREGWWGGGNGSTKKSTRRVWLNTIVTEIGIEEG